MVTLVMVDKPGDSDGGGKNPGHVADHYAPKKLRRGYNNGIILKYKLVITQKLSNYSTFDNYSTFE